MKEDFLWVHKVLKNPGNGMVHYEALRKLIELFMNKWEHKKKDPKYAESYSIYCSFLRRYIRYNFHQD